MPQSTLCIVTLGVKDLARAAAFYEALGWPRTRSSTDEIVWFRTPHSYLGLFGYEALAEDAGLPADPKPAYAGVTLAICTGSEGEADRVFAAALGAGARPLKQPQKAPWGGYSGYFADPDGYAWEVAFNPHFAIEGGRLLIP